MKGLLRVNPRRLPTEPARAWMAVCLGAILAGVCGCPDGGPPKATGPIERENPMSKVVGRVNANSAWLNFVLEAHGEVKAQHMKPDGKPEPFDGTVALIYRRPRDLAMKIEHTLGGNVMQAGSNRDEFWVWKKLNEDVYWWGRHAELDPQAAAKLPIRPDQLAEVIGVSGLPTQTDPQRGPRFDVMAEYYQLTYYASDRGRSYPCKRIKIDRRWPYLVCGVEFLSPAGRETAVACLGAYAKVEGNAVLIPREIWIDWPAQQEYLHMTFNAVQPYAQDPARVFTSPRQLGSSIGKEIRVDRQPAPTADQP